MSAIRAGAGSIVFGGRRRRRRTLIMATTATAYQKLLSVGTKIVCVGRNYAAHAKELGNAVPKVFPVYLSLIFVVKKWNFFDLGFFPSPRPDFRYLITDCWTWKKKCRSRYCFWSLRRRIWRTEATLRFRRLWNPWIMRWSWLSSSVNVQGMFLRPLPWIMLEVFSRISFFFLLFFYWSFFDSYNVLWFYEDKVAVFILVFFIK